MGWSRYEEASSQVQSEEVFVVANENKLGKDFET